MRRGQAVRTDARVPAPRAGEPYHEAAPGHAAVRGFLHRAAPPGADGLVLTHGAGGDCASPLLVALAAAFAEAGLTVLRCDLPYRQARRKGPPSVAGAARDRDGLRQAARAVRGLVPGRVFLGGQSYGGRQASLLVAEAPEVADALLLLSYPLHPPGRAREQRTTHFPRLCTPALFVHGSVDPFGSLEELEAARTLIGGTTAVLAVDGAGHGLGRGARRPAPPAATVEAVVQAFLAFVGVNRVGVAEPRRGPAKLPPAMLAGRLERILACAGRLIASVPEPYLEHKGSGRDRTLRALAYHVFRLGLAFADAMDLGRLPEAWLADEPPPELREGAAVARYGALVQGRLAGWFEGAMPREYARVIDVHDGPLSGHDLLERITGHAARHLRQLHAVVEELGIAPLEPLPVADLEGLPRPADSW